MGDLADEVSPCFLRWVTLADGVYLDLMVGVCAKCPESYDLGFEFSVEAVNNEQNLE